LLCRMARAPRVKPAGFGIDSVKNLSISASFDGLVSPIVSPASSHGTHWSIHGDEAFGFLYLLHQIVHGHGSGPHFRSVDRAEAAS
jgi:hypothetical protein